MRYIQNYTNFILNENYNQALAISKKHDVDISPVLTLLLKGENNISNDKYTVPYDLNKERKNRTLIGLFTKMYVEDKASIESLRVLLEFLDKYKASELEIRNNKNNTTQRLGNILDIYKIVSTNNDGRSVVETLSDAISEYNKTIVVKKWIRQMPSVMREYFSDSYNYKALDEALLPYHNLTIEDKKKVEKIFFGDTTSKGKISVYENRPNTFTEDLTSVLIDLGLTYDKVLELLKTTSGTKLIFQNESVMVLKVYTFEASRIFGEKVSWCISRESHYFKDYYQTGRNQLLFVLNYNADYVVESKIGLCYTKHGSYYTAHDKKDNEMSEYAVIDYLKRYHIPESILKYHEIEEEIYLKQIYDCDIDLIYSIFESDDNKEKQKVIDIIGAEILTIINDDIHRYIIENEDVKKIMFSSNYISVLEDDSKYLSLFVEYLNSSDDGYYVPSNFPNLLDVCKYDLTEKALDGIYRGCKNNDVLIYLLFVNSLLNKKLFDIAKHNKTHFNFFHINMNKEIYDLLDKTDINLAEIQKEYNIKYYDISRFSEEDVKFFEDCVLSPKNLLDNTLLSNDFKMKSIKKSFTYYETPQDYVIFIIRTLSNADTVKLVLLFLKAGFKDFGYYPYVELAYIPAEYLNQNKDFLKHILSNKNRGVGVIKTLIDKKIVDVITYLSVNEIIGLTASNSEKYFDFIVNNIEICDKSIFAAKDAMCMLDYIMERHKLPASKEKYVISNITELFDKNRHQYYFMPDVLESDDLFYLLAKYNKIPHNITIPKDEISYLNDERVAYGKEHLGLKIEE